jgi:hypothetical protein
MKLSIALLFIILTSCNSSSEKVTNDELLDILDIHTWKVPTFAKKQWTIDIIPDTLQKRKVVSIEESLTSESKSLIAVKFDNDSTITYTLIQNKNSSSQGIFNLKQSRYEIEWNNGPELLYGKTFVVATISYEQNDNNAGQNLNYLMVIELNDELKI